MRPLRSISRKNQVQKSSQLINTTTVQSRLLSSFSKLTNKKQLGSSVSYSQQSIEIYPPTTPVTLSSCYYHKQSYNNNNNNYIQKSTLQHDNNAPKINRISLTIEQKLYQKQNIIQQLRIQLQQYKYIISSLKQQIKQLNYSQLANSNKQKQNSINHVSSSGGDDIVVRCRNCIEMEGKMAEMKFLKDKQKRDDQFMQMYEEMIEKLTDNIRRLQYENNMLKQNNTKQTKETIFRSNDLQLTIHQPQLRQNPNFFNQIRIINVPNSLQQSRQSSEWDVKSDVKGIVINNSKQNHPCTPKNKLPLSNSKLSGFKSTKFTSQSQDENYHSSALNQSKQSKSIKRSINSSPQKIRQKLTKKKSINLINENIIPNQYQTTLGLKKLDRKIYF